MKETESRIFIPDSTIKRFQEGFIEVGAYKDLPIGNEVITTSGETITPYFLNSEKLLRDSDISKVLKSFANQPEKLIEYAWNQSSKQKRFGKEVELIADAVFELNPNYVAGGMRRDVIFSGPAAILLQIPHYSIFKTAEGESMQEQPVVMTPSMYRDSYQSIGPIKGKTILVSDLLTKGSSQYRQDTINGQDVGWIPKIRSIGSEISDVLVIADRNEGGKERLKDIGVNTHAFMPVTDDFLEQVSSGENLEVAKEYNKSPREWTKKYLLENGVTQIMKKSFEKGQDDRVIKLVNNYRAFLNENKYNNKTMIEDVRAFTKEYRPTVYQKLFKTTQMR